MLLVTGCRRSDPPPVVEAAEASTVVDGTTLASVGGRRIPAERWVIRAGRPGRLPVEDQARKVLDELILREQLVARALREGLDRDPAVLRSFEAALIARLKERELDAKTCVPHEHAAGKSETMETANEEPPDQVRLAVLRIEVGPKPGPEKLKRAELRLEEARALAKKGLRVETGFGALAVSHSDDVETRLSGGDLGWLDTDPGKYNVDASVLKAGMSLESPGEISPVIRGQEAVYLVRLIEKRPGIRRGARSENLGGQQRQWKEFAERRRKAEEAFLDETRRMIPVVLNTNLVEARIAELEKDARVRATEPPSVR